MQAEHVGDRHVDDPTGHRLCGLPVQLFSSPVGPSLGSMGGAVKFRLTILQTLEGFCAWSLADDDRSPSLSQLEEDAAERGCDRVLTERILGPD